MFSPVIQGYFLGGYPRLASLVRAKLHPHSNATFSTAKNSSHLAISPDRNAGSNAVLLPATMFGSANGHHGLPLPDNLRSRLESVFHTSLGGVRLHESGVVQRLGAIAYTRGDQIHFAPGQLNLNGPKGLRLLGHELAHVVQQKAGRASNPFGQGVALVTDPNLEAMADSMGMRVMNLTYSPPIGRTVQAAPSARIFAPHGRVLQRMDTGEVKQKEPEVGGTCTGLILTASSELTDDCSALMDVFYLTQTGKATVVQTIDRGVDFSVLANGAKIYMVGHGGPGFFITKLCNAETLAGFLEGQGAKAKNVRAIKFMSCASGVGGHLSLSYQLGRLLNIKTTGLVATANLSGGSLGDLSAAKYRARNSAYDEEAIKRKSEVVNENEKEISIFLTKFGIIGDYSSESIISASIAMAELVGDWYSSLMAINKDYELSKEKSKIKFIPE